ncbi:hypothetical protein BJ170DRAFT_130431 [Xylariales sp. AK1849]|nr:hypothetical protein BJ170DRAFT_130431 [Xylariales sp. AK1849]
MGEPLDTMIDSDTESDFYGDEEIVADFELKVEEFDVGEWWTHHRLHQTPLKLQSKKQALADATHLHNPYAGVSYAWQLTETVDDFLNRLPPATTDEVNVGSWIFICNPYIDRKNKDDAQNQKVRGSENEAPEEAETDLGRFVEGGTERLHFVTAFQDEMKKTAMTAGVRTREKNIAAADATTDILELAHELHVRSGKWMLFCPVHSVNDVWGTVAEATATNELGIAAKVATRRDVDQRTERLICVYTADFADKADVKRVALKLKQLGLYQANGKPLYYKPDAYTYLGIGSGNAWGIRASIYNTRDMIGKS